MFFGGIAATSINVQNKCNFYLLNKAYFYQEILYKIALQNPSPLAHKSCSGLFSSHSRQHVYVNPGA